jgi:DNA-binding phage protein
VAGDRKAVEEMRVSLREQPKGFELLFAQAVNACLEGDTRRAKSALRLLVNATIGFDALSMLVGRPAKSLHRMLAEDGNPTLENFAAILAAIQNETRVRLEVSVRSLEE